MKAKRCLLACLLACLFFHPSFAQCLPAIPDTAVCAGTESLVADNEIIGAGTTKFFYGAPSVFTSLRIQAGGKLIVCGELQVNDFGMQGGTLVITRMGRLIVNTSGGASMIFTGGCSVYNTGYFRILSNLVLDGPDAWTNPSQPNIVWNGRSGMFEMANTYFVLQKGNCFFVNKGTANFSGIINSAQSDSASVCLGNMSRTYVSLLENRRRYAYVAPEGPACVFVRSWGFSYENLTLWPSVFICRSPSYCLSGCGVGTQNWGAASLMNSCSSCNGMFLLPLETTVQIVRPQSLLEDPTITPNPFSQEFSVLLPQNEFILEIKLISTNGNIVYTMPVGKLMRRIPVRPGVALPHGIYFVQITTKLKTFTLRVIKQ